jgi:hypothetical protein
VWDADAFVDDKLGCLELDLTDMMVAANQANNCGLSNIKRQKKTVKTVKCNMFVVETYSGWWPFVSPDGKKKLAV